MEQSIARFEKRLDDANDALKTLGSHLGRGAQGSYKEVTTALAALRREAAKTNKQALKDFDSLKTAVTQKVPTRAAKKASTTTKKATAGSTRTGSRSTGSRKAASRTTAARSTSSRSTSSRSTGTRSKSTRAKKSS